MKTPWDKTRKRRKRSSVSQDIRDTRKWLMVTYGGHWGKLQSAAERAAKMEKRLTARNLEIRDLKAELRARSH
jgi:hypothetical protein